MRKKIKDPLLVRFLGKNGYDGEAKAASKYFVRGRTYRVTGGSMGQSHTSLTFYGVPGSYNSVMFDSDVHAIAELIPGMNQYRSKWDNRI